MNVYWLSADSNEFLSKSRRPANYTGSDVSGSVYINDQKYDEDEIAINY
jgi:hypothetical protein